jgi:DNA-binding Lrp family transcriptional regulator
MLKPQDCIILLKLLANPKVNWSQRQLAEALCISLAETNAGLKRLLETGLLRKANETQFLPIIAAVEEFLIVGLKYLIPGRLGEYTRGVPTAVGAPLFHDKIAKGSDPIPVWPDAHGTERGVALNPIHPSVPKALRKTPDQAFYELLVLVDAIRSGRARERNMAIQLLKNRIRDENE